ncbi:MAG: U32 family peptidase [Desulfamplus sp.]|nr:U32 family peptidase [Desulfamplus sp.]
MNNIKTVKPKILAPAGDKYSFFAAIAAGADAIYCGLKNFSARMEADNFSIEELSRLNALARSKNVQVYLAFNSFVKNNELEQASRIIAKISKYVRPHALIIQDPGLIEIARNVGFKGEFHLSTLGNCSFSMGLESALNAGFSRVVLPRELSIDEIKLMAEKKPDGLDLEVFIHGALCYAVSGRCYWSSWFGGRSGLRGRCVQPCRRLYRQSQEPKQDIQSSSKLKKFQEPKKIQNPQEQEKLKSLLTEERFFSCLDFSADVLVKVLKTINGVTTWKIEGRKKSPHYVFYTVKAYKMLRDHGDDPAQKKIVISFLEYALGRPATHYNLLTQNPINPLKKDKDVETGSGLFAGRIRYGGENLKPNVPNFITREELLKDDLIRIGYEDDNFHTIQKVTISVPKKGRFILQQSKTNKFTHNKQTKLKSNNSDLALSVNDIPIVDKKNRYNHDIKIGFKKGTPVFIVDRREKEVWQLINELEAEFDKYSSPDVRPQEINGSFNKNYPLSHYLEKNGLDEINFGTTISKNSSKFPELFLYGQGDESKIKKVGSSFMKNGLWLSENSIKRCFPKRLKEIWWFLPPVIWPSNEKSFYETVRTILLAGAKNFVLNMPWQISCFNRFFLSQKSTKLNQESSDSKQGSTFNKHQIKNNLNNLNLWAGPFCNVGNVAYIEFLKKSGFSGIFVTPELGKDDFISLPAKSPLPLGIIVKGNFPLAISRIVSDEIIPNQLFVSPRGENSWVMKRKGDFWVFPNWQIDLSNNREILKQAGYRLFLNIDEPIPNDIGMKQRPGLWNWEIGLL